MEKRLLNLEREVQQIKASLEHVKKTTQDQQHRASWDMFPKQCTSSLHIT